MTYPAQKASMHSIHDIRTHLRALGARERHEMRVLRLWVQAKPQDSGRRPLESFMPKSKKCWASWNYRIKPTAGGGIERRRLTCGSVSIYVLGIIKSLLGQRHLFLGS
jgi:hypothetical protein